MDDQTKILEALSGLQSTIDSLKSRMDRLEKKSITKEQTAYLEIPCFPPSGKPFGYGQSSRYADIETKRREVIKAIELLDDAKLTRATKTLFFTPKRRYCVSMSRLTDKRYRPYSYSYCPEWHAYLLAADEGQFILGMLDRDEAYAIPVGEMIAMLPFLSETVRKGPRKWNITLALLEDGELAVHLPEPLGPLRLSPFRFPV